MRHNKEYYGLDDLSDEEFELVQTKAALFTILVVIAAFSIVIPFL